VFQVMMNKQQFWHKLIRLLGCLALLGAHLTYLLVTNPQYFPINTVKISATYQQIPRAQLAEKLRPYLQQGFYGVSTRALQAELMTLAWSDQVSVTRVWPDTVKIVLQEKKPIARWHKQLLSAKGEVLPTAGDEEEWRQLPLLQGADEERLTVLEAYLALRERMQPYGLGVAALNLRRNRAWEMTLSNGARLRLGKDDLLARVERFCRAYPVVFAGKDQQVATVDLRYAHGMTVQWE